MAADPLTLGWYVENGCELTKPDPTLLTIIMMTEEPCRRCNCKDTCPAWPKVRIEKAKRGGSDGR